MSKSVCQFWDTSKPAHPEPVRREPVQRDTVSCRGDPRYEAAASLLPPRLRQTALGLSPEKQVQAEELRLRAGQAMTAVFPWGEEAFSRGKEAFSRGEDAFLRGEEAFHGTVQPEDLEALCDIATEFSRYATAETLREGFLSVRGGFRVGLCGTAVMKDGTCTNLRDLSSAAIRISRERRDAGAEVAPLLFREGVFQNTLLLSPPGGGKTTLLRDLVRRLSSGVGKHAPRRVSLLDERGEVAVMYRGQPQMDVGTHTDVLDGCPKALGILMVLRAMNPQIIAADEITVREDLRAVILAGGCGAGLLATVHAGSVEEMRERALYRDLLAEGVFRLAVRILWSGTERRYEVAEL